MLGWIGWGGGKINIGDGLCCMSEVEVKFFGLGISMVNGGGDNAI